MRRRLQWFLLWMAEALDKEALDHAVCFRADAIRRGRADRGGLRGVRVFVCRECSDWWIRWPNSLPQLECPHCSGALQEVL